MRAQRHECIVVGSGPAGLGAAAMLRRAGVETLVLERALRTADSWHGRYDGFRLNTSSWFSYLPGRRLPRSSGRWPSRDSLVGYYERYARDHDLRIVHGVALHRIAHGNPGWTLETSQGPYRASCVVIATGKYNEPKLPDWPGADGFTGEITHSARYRNPHPYRGRRVLVVGPGASGFEIATQIGTSGSAPAWLSIRTPPHIVHRNVGPFPSDLFAVLARRLPVRLVDSAAELIRRASLGDLRSFGLAPPPDGIYSRVMRTGMIPTVDGPYLRAIKQGHVKIVPAVVAFERGNVTLADGSRLQPDVVIAATGYHRKLEGMVGHLGVLDGDGRPRANGGRPAASAPGIFFIGFSEPFSGNLRELRLDAERIAPAVAAHLSRLEQRESVATA